jgi:hypothetical protein
MVIFDSSVELPDRIVDGSSIEFFNHTPRLSWVPRLLASFSLHKFQGSFWENLQETIVFTIIFGNTHGVLHVFTSIFRKYGYFGHFSSN